MALELGRIEELDLFEFCSESKIILVFRFNVDIDNLQIGRCLVSEVLGLVETTLDEG